MKIKEAARRAQAGRTPGRPRSFDAEKALDAAMEVFWRKGYEGASLSDLTESMGINRPSLYAAFGNKEALFRKSLDRYSEGPAGYVRAALEESTARAAIEKLLQRTADMATDSSHPAGCLFVQGALACGNEGKGIRNDLIVRRNAGERAVRQRLHRAKAEGELPPKADPAGLARYFVTVMQGIAVQAAGGATRRELRRVVQTALEAWPR